MMKTRFFALIVVFVFGFFLPSCNTSKSLNQQNFSNIYAKNEVRIHPDFSVYHVNENQTEVLISIPTDKLQYATGLTANTPLARVKITYELYNSYDDALPLDSGSSVLNDTLYEDKPHKLVARVVFPTQFGKKYISKIQLTDLNRKTNQLNIVLIDKTDITNAQNFQLMSPESKQPKFSHHLKKEEPIYISFNEKSKSDLRVRYYYREYDLPPPPFAVYNPKNFDYQADSIFGLIKKEHGFFELSLPKRGMYHILSDYSQKNGLTLYHFDNHFPKVETPEDLIDPLRYITKKQEYEELINAADQKLAIDKFWLSISPSKDRAKRLIKEFYNRVIDANRYFSSYVEGWKTDRGIIYVVFGEPDVIYKNSGGESWIYGEEGAYLSVTFNFVKVSNPFSDNDYRLNRSPIYKDAWYKAVEAWRNGRVSINP